MSKLYGEQMREICEVLGVDANALPDNLYSTLLNAIKEAAGATQGGIDTSDATATAEDIAKGKTAYVKGIKVEGVKKKGLKELLDSKREWLKIDADNAETSALFARTYLTDISEYISYEDTAELRVANSLFYYCVKLQSIPLLDFSSITKMNNSFQNCWELCNLPLFDFHNLVEGAAMFMNCTSLETIPALDFRSANNLSGWVHGCLNIKNINVKNIKCSFQVGLGVSYGHKLTLESLLHLCKELRITDSALDFTVGAENLTKLANVYVRLVDITDEMRANDDLIDEKFPFEVCESTDEGALSIEEYLSSKNWQLG